MQNPDSAARRKSFEAAAANENKNSLRPSFNKVTVPRHARWAFIFEEHAEISGIAGRYLFPKGVSVPALETALIAMPLEPQSLTFCRTLWQQLISLNKGLKAVVVNKGDVEDLYHALMGVTSGFNVDDINYFMDLNRKGVPAAAYLQSQMETARRINEIEKRVGHAMYWVASPATLRKITDKLNKKDQHRRRSAYPKV